MSGFLKHISLGAIILLIATSDILCQSYYITPGDSIVDDAPYNDLTHFNILEQNITTGTLVFSWQQISLSIPSGWLANLCDNGHCYFDFPISGTMDSVYNGEYGLMAVGINPYNIDGTAIISYAVWEENSPFQIDTLTWIITSNSETMIKDSESNNTDYIIYPNPSKKDINILSKLNSSFSYCISDIYGNIVLKGNSSTSFVNVKTENLKNAVYNISIFDNTSFIKSTQFLIQH